MSHPGMPPGPRRRWQLFLRGLLLGAAFLIPLVLMRGKSATFDEVAHLPAGYSYLTTGLFKINPQHPPLIKEICALPLLFMDVKMPVDRETLKRREIPLTYQWGFGQRFLYSQDADRLLFWGRVPALVLFVGLAVLVMLWSRRLWGEGGALLALLLIVFDPTLVAHAQLVTTDVGLAFFATLFLYLLRRYLEAPSGRRLVFSGLALGLALASKFSAVILIPMAILLVGLAAWNGPGGGAPDEPPRKGKGSRKGGKAKPGRTTAADPFRGGDRTLRILSAAGTTGILFALAGLTVWAIYLFPTDPFFYLKGLQAVNRDHDPNYLPYLMGEMRPGGWRTYLLIAWIVKTPIPSLLLLAAAGVFFLRGRRAGWLDEAFLAIPALGFFFGYSLTADNLGVRYLIPCFPFFFVFTARVAPLFASASRWAKSLGVLVLVWYLSEFAAIWPDHLSYFNEITGVPARGFEWLDDSNLDWGQGLIQLRRYLDVHPVADYRLCYFGSGEPGYYGIRGRSVGINALTSPPTPGTLILSAHCVARARAQLSRLHGEGQANWIAHVAPKDVVGHAYFIYEFK